MTFTAPEKPRLVELIKELAIVHGKVTLSSGLEADYYVDLRRATLHHEAELQAQAATDFQRQLGAFVHGGTGPSAKVGHQGALNLGAGPADCTGRPMDTVGLCILFRDVHPAPGKVDAQVLPEIDQLQGSADPVGHGDQHLAVHGVVVGDFAGPFPFILDADYPGRAAKAA